MPLSRQARSLARVADSFRATHLACAERDSVLSLELRGFAGRVAVQAHLAPIAVVLGIAGVRALELPAAPLARLVGAAGALLRAADVVRPAVVVRAQLG